MITSIESKIFFLRERVMLFNDAIDCKVDVAAMAHEWNMSMQHWRNDTDREWLRGGTNKFFNIIYVDQFMKRPNQTLQQIQ